MAEIGVHAWGQRAEDWLAGAEYAARLLRGHQQPLAAEHSENEASAAAALLQNHPNAAAYPAACRDTPAAPPPFAGIPGLYAVSAASRFGSRATVAGTASRRPT